MKAKENTKSNSKNGLDAVFLGQTEEFEDENTVLSEHFFRTG